MAMTKNVLIVGTGGIGKRHVRGFLKTGRVRLSVVEPDVPRREETVSAYPIERAYADLGEVDLAQFDLAVICTPAPTHVALGQRCADAGVCFLLEKPLSTSLDGVDQLIRTVGEKNLIARLGYVRRAGPELIAMRQQVQSGRIGALRMCYMNISQDFPKYRPDYQQTYYARAASGGGAILDAASHFIDVLLWFFGAPVQVMAMYDRLQLQGVECEDACLISVRFADGAMAQININQFQKPNTATIEMIGTAGNLRLDHAVLKFADDDSGRWQETDYMQGLTPPELHEQRFRYQADLALNAIEGRPDHLATLEEGRANLRVALAAKESYRTGRMIGLSDA